MSRPSLSVPFRAPSPSPSAIRGQRSRPSLSSQSSARSVVEADFEAALLNPGHTVFLSGSPSLGTAEEDHTGHPNAAIASPGGVAGSSAIVNTGKGLRSSSSSPQTGPGHSRRDGVDVKDGDLDGIREERSYEDDLNDLKGVDGMPTRIDAMDREDIADIGGRPQAPGLGVIPPTPTTLRGAHTRKVSEISTDSADSIMRRLGPSLGIDAELNEPKHMAPHKNKTVSPGKRRSIFRSPGTASSPDLATLVQRAKAKPTEGAAQPQASVPVPPAQSSTAASPAKKVSPSNGITPSTSFASTNTATSYASAQTTQLSEKPSPDSWEAVSNGKGSSSYRRAAIGNDSRNRSNSGETDGFRSVRSRAKGIFGKMFGSSSSREASGSTPSTPASSSRFSHDSPKPPVPSLPAQYAPSIASSNRTPERDRTATPATSARPDTHARSATIGSLASTTTPPRHARTSTESAAMSTDKPLPGTPDAAPGGEGTVKRNGGHSRQPADEGIEEESERDLANGDRVESGAGLSRIAAASPFQVDVSKILNDIGDEPAADGLGVSHASVRRKREATPTGIPRDKDKVVLLSTPPDRDRAFKPEQPPSLSPRKSSLAQTANIPADSGPLATASSFLSPPLSDEQAVNTNLPSRSSSLSRTNSTSSRRQPKFTRKSSGGPPHTQILPPDSALPHRSTDALDDFGPALPRASTSNRTDGHPQCASEEEDEATLRSKSSRLPSLTVNTPVVLPMPARQSPYNAEKGGTKSSLSPGSIRLVTPQPLDPDTLHADIASSAFRANSPWGAQSVQSLHSPGHGATGTPGWSPSSDRQGWPGRQTERTVSGASAGGLDDEKGRKLACDFLEGRYDTVQANRVAEFLGGPQEINRVALKYYMQYFDMTGQTLVESFRDLCQKLHLKAESQEIDRILAAFSDRYFRCNPATVFATPDVVHTVTGAMLMLNTDLHIADLVKRMSRADFVRNALRAVQESLPASTHAANTSSLAGGNKNADGPTPSLSANRDGDDLISDFVYTKTWELEAENALKDIYTQVRADRILLPISSVTSPHSANSNRQSMISVASGHPERATASRTLSGQSAQNKRASMRGSPANWPYGGTYSISNGQLSPQSPQSSFSASIDGTIANMTPTIGFASNLSHAVIKEHEADETGSVLSAVSASTLDTDLDEDELALLGAPWAKEGILSHKPITDKGGKKPKSKDWKQYFAVIQKGELFIFTFGSGSGGGSMGGALGGGNWLNNANAIATWNLIHAHAEALYPPGTRLPSGTQRPPLSSDRPNAFSLSLPGEEQMLFQAGTEELVLEWVQTCNYWAAKRSRQPLQGGVSNMEYGWNRVTSGEADNLDREFDALSLRSHRSNRSNLSKLGGAYGRRAFGTASGGLAPGDRVFINDWVPPMPAFVPSPLDEEAQLEALQGYLQVLQEDLDTHKVVEEPMRRLYGPGSKNGSRARMNWVARDRYLRDEHKKYETYIEALKEAIALRFKKQGEKRLEKSLKRSAASLHRRDSDDQLDQMLGNGDRTDFGGSERGREREGTADTITARKGGRR